jgi:hypothetical protein
MKQSLVLLCVLVLSVACSSSTSPSEQRSKDSDSENLSQVSAETDKEAARLLERFFSDHQAELDRFEKFHQEEEAFWDRALKQLSPKEGAALSLSSSSPMPSDEPSAAPDQTATAVATPANTPVPTEGALEPAPTVSSQCDGSLGLAPAITCKAKFGCEHLPAMRDELQRYLNSLKGQGFEVPSGKPLGEIILFISRLKIMTKSSTAAMNLSLKIKYLEATCP